MASSALRSLSRRKLSPKWFCKTSSSSPPLVLLHHDHVKDYNTKPTTFSDSSLLRFHRQVFFEDSKNMSFGQPLGASSGVFLCRHISSSSCKPEESSINIDALGEVLVPAEKSVEAMSTTIDGCSAAAIEIFSFPVNCVHYVINGIHDLTGSNWLMSTVITAFLVNELMSPVSMRLQRQAAELNYWGRSIQKVRRVMQTCDPESLAKQKKWEAECRQKFGKCYKSYLPLSIFDLFISISFINGINTMANKIPGFTDISTPDSFYILPLVTALTFWLTRQATTISWTEILFRMKELPWYFLFFIMVQAAVKYEPAVYVYLISYRISLYILSMCKSLFSSLLFLTLSFLFNLKTVDSFLFTPIACRNKQVAKLRKALGLPYDPVTFSEEQRIMAKVISVMREFLDVVKKKKDKK
ncbi:unnamed protein product [Eruca vesicaria subsp. sativa]|uniref:Uncharacterized protein n=1 Tax=Eruca vesicaria subsp. sativa TaxID=29727 RepID=A0ABC8LT37_ERUVS|nr:unnamed protein product [Eruca vesicaria subsp. sativa]